MEPALDFPVLLFERRGGLIPFSTHEEFVVRWYRGESLDDFIGTRLVDCSGAMFEIRQVRKLRPWPDSRWARFLKALRGDRYSVVEYELEPKGAATDDDVRSMIDEALQTALAGRTNKGTDDFYSDAARLRRAQGKVKAVRTVRQLVRTIEKTYYFSP